MVAAYRRIQSPSYFARYEVWLALSLHLSGADYYYYNTIRRAGSFLFCPVLLPSLVRGLATPWTYFLHLSLSSVILIDSSTGSPVHVLMLSIQAVRGLPRLRAPGIVPCTISFSKQLPCFLMV